MGDREQLLKFIQRSLSSSLAILEPKTQDQWKKKLPNRYGFLSVRQAVDGFINNRKEKRWVIMPGLRGTGKTTILAQIFCYLNGNKKIPLKNILYLSLDEVVSLHKSNLYDVVSAYEEFIGSKLENLKEKVFILIDEAHYDNNWALTIKDIFRKTDNVFIYTTGSSALAFHSNADVSRRARIERLYPMRFIEYITLKQSKYPIRGLASKITDTIFLSNSAQEVLAKLKALNNDIIKYWSEVSETEIKTYLDFGSLPFVLPLSRADAYQRIINMVNNVVYKDLILQSSFTNDTLVKFPGLLMVLATNEDISIQSISDAIGSNHQTTNDMLEALNKCEIIDTVYSYGGAHKKLNKPPRYVFLAPIIKAAFLWNMGRFTGDHAFYGKLLEDSAVLYFFILKHKEKIVDVTRRWGKGEADYVITTADGKRIIFEFSFGANKTGAQVEHTAKQVSSKYGIVVSDRELKVENSTIFIPKRTFFLL